MLTSRLLDGLREDQLRFAAMPTEASPKCVSVGVLVKLAESCVIEQHIGRLLKGVEPNAGCGGTDCAHCTRLGDRQGGGTQGGTGCSSRYQLIWKTPSAELFVPRAWKRPGLHAHSLQRFVRRNGSPVTQSSGRCDVGWTVDSTTKGGWQASRAMQVMFVFGLEFALSKSPAPREITRIGLQDDIDLHRVCCSAQPLLGYH